jgi:hypothetical protein
VTDLDAQISAAVLLLEAGTSPELDGSARAAKVVAALDRRRMLRMLSTLRGASFCVASARQHGALCFVGFGET